MTAWPLIVTLLALSAGCATSPPKPAQLPAAPAEMKIPAPPPQHFQMRLEQILSDWPKKLTPSPTGSAPAKP